MSISPSVAWVGFVVCLVLILYSGTRLSRYGNMIAVRTGLGGTWVGVVLVASVTSLPELITGLSAIVVVGQPDLAAGDALGSCIFNLMIIVILDSVYRTESIYTRMHQGHVLSASFGVILLGMVAGSIVLHGHFSGLRIAHVGPYSLIAPLIYALAMRSVFYYERRERKEFLEEVAEVVSEAAVEPEKLSLNDLYVRYGASAAVTLVAGTGLPMTGEALSVAMGWDRTFVGTILLALATSVPEVVISVEAVRLAAVDLAIGNLLGSNLFDLIILAADDLALTDGPLLASTSTQHLFTAVTALTMTGIVVAGLTYRPKKRVLRFVGWASLGLLALGSLNALVLFLLT